MGSIPPLHAVIKLGCDGMGTWKLLQSFRHEFDSRTLHWPCSVTVSTLDFDSGSGGFEFPQGY